MSKIIFYYQTFTDKDNQYILLDPVLYKNTPVTHIHLSSIHFGTDLTQEPYIHLNNRSPYHSYFDPVWNTIQQASSKNIKIVIMIGGAGGGYSSLFSNFDLYYDLLSNLIKNKPCIQGIDLDIEEPCSLDNIKMLINKIVEDFGADFIISTAPIQSSLSNDQPGMGGFCYKDLITSKEGQYIDYINCQAYGSYSLEVLDSIVNNGYSSTKIVMGMLSGQNYQVELKKMVEKYKDTFGGVFIWEYFNTVPSALDWLNNIKTIYGDDTSSII